MPHLETSSVSASPPPLIKMKEDAYQVFLRSFEDNLYLEREQMLSLRLQKMQTLNLPKRNLKADWEEAFSQKNERLAFGKRSYILGHVSEYDHDEVFSFGKNIFVHNNVVRFHSGDTKLHSDIPDRFVVIFQKGLQKAGISHLKGGVLGSSFPLLNLFGCKSIFGKVPDGGFLISKSLGTEFFQFPVIITEVAVTNESLDILLHEGAAWLSEGTNVQYFIGYYFKMEEEFYMKIILLGRASPPAIFSDEDEILENYKNLKEIQKKKRNSYNYNCLRKLKPKPTN